ncbi:MAG: beta-galactosidase [Solirubrobacteraceae bacterium]
MALNGGAAGAKRLALRTAGAGAVAVSGSLDVGLNTNVGGWSDEAARMNEIESQSGTKWMREAFDWSQIEPRRGTYDFSRYDWLVTLAAQNKVHLVANLVDTPSWAGAAWNTIPTDPSGFAEFVSTIVGRYGPHGSFWSTHPDLPKVPVRTYELLNEPYYDNGNAGDYDPGRYARLVKAAGTAGHSADRGAGFLLAAENEARSVGDSWMWWVAALYQAVPDLNDYFDGVAVHPYGTDLTNLSYPTPGRAYTGYDQIRRVESIRREFVAHDAADKPLWLTEVGWPTCTDGGSSRCTTTTGQAQRIQSVFDYARRTWKDYVQGIFVYGYQDNGQNSADPDNDYGLVTWSGAAKPSLAVFKNQLALG